MRKKVSTKLLSLILLSGTLIVYSCNKKKKDDPTPEEFKHTVSICVKKGHTEDIITDYELKLVHPDGTLENIDDSRDISQNNKEFVLDVTDFKDGKYILKVTKEEYIDYSHDFEITNEHEDINWNLPLEYYMTHYGANYEVKSNEENDFIVSEDTEVIIHEGSLNSDETISITEVDVALEHHDIEIFHEREILKTIHFEPDGLTFDKPIEVILEVEEIPEVKAGECVLQLGYWDEEKNEWEIAPVKEVDGKCVAYITHFSDWSLFESIKYEVVDLGYTEYIPLGFSECGEAFEGTYTADGYISELAELFPFDDMHHTISFDVSYVGTEGKVTEIDVRYHEHQINVYESQDGGDNYEEIGSFIIPALPFDAQHIERDCQEHEGGSGS